MSSPTYQAGIPGHQKTAVNENTSAQLVDVAGASGVVSGQLAMTGSLAQITSTPCRLLLIAPSSSNVANVAFGSSAAQNTPMAPTNLAGFSLPVSNASLIGFIGTAGDTVNWTALQ